MVEEDLMPELTTPRKVHVMLGGEVTRVKTYGQLVTSIINPSHVISAKQAANNTDSEGNSLMPDFSEAMTVRQMTDIAEFLQARYELVIPRKLIASTVLKGEIESEDLLERTREL